MNPRTPFRRPYLQFLETGPLKDANLVSVVIQCNAQVSSLVRKKKWRTKLVFLTSFLYIYLCQIPPGRFIENIGVWLR